MGWKVMRPSHSEVVFYKHRNVWGLDEADDLLRFFDSNEKITIIDAGANVGQSVKKYKEIFPQCIVHSFEPVRKVFDQLKNNVSEYKDVSVYNMALGSQEGKITFYEYDDHVNSSALPMGSALSQHNVYRETQVECSTLDIQASKNNIGHINILKLDTQGFDLEVLKGARKLIEENRVDIVMIEHIVAELYKNSPPYWEQVKFFEDHKFQLVVSYRLNMDKGVVTWFDSVYKREGLKSRP